MKCRSAPWGWAIFHGRIYSPNRTRRGSLLLGDLLQRRNIPLYSRWLLDKLLDSFYIHLGESQEIYCNYLKCMYNVICNKILIINIIYHSKNLDKTLLYGTN